MNMEQIISDVNKIYFNSDYPEPDMNPPDTEADRNRPGSALRGEYKDHDYYEEPTGE